MSTVPKLIDAMESGNSVDIINSFNQVMSEKIASRLDDFRQQVAKNMFAPVQEQAQEGQDLDEQEMAAPAKVHPNAIHVQHVGGGKYKVHAVGKNWQDGIKHGEHLSDSELDDFSEMGGKIKHVK